MPKTASKTKAAVAMFPATVRFEYMAETPGAWRYQEHSADGVPMIGDEDGAKIGALYLRKAKFPVAPKSIVVTIVE